MSGVTGARHQALPSNRAVHHSLGSDLSSDVLRRSARGTRCGPQRRNFDGLTRLKKEPRQPVTGRVSFGSNWLAGDVRRPQNYTLSWVARALGYERRFVRI